MEQEDDETDEDEEFLRLARKIIDDYAKGEDVSHLVRRLKRPEHSYDEEATRGIYKALELIGRNSFNETTRSPSASPPIHSSASPINDSPGLSRKNGSARSWCPTTQIGENRNNEVNERPSVPKLELDFSVPSSVDHSPQLDPLAVDIPDPSTISLRRRMPSLHCCRQCHTPRNYLNASDFLYLLIFGFITSLIVYYLYLPPLHKGPVF